MNDLILILMMKSDIFDPLDFGHIDSVAFT